MNLDFSKLENIQRKDGGEFRIYATDHTEGYPVAGAVKLDSGAWGAMFWRLDGTSCHRRDQFSLIAKPRRITGWVNVCADDTLERFVFSTKEKAKSFCSNIGQIYIDAEIQG